MPIDEFIINIYLMVEQYYKIVVTKPLRSAGYAPKLSDPEVICMEMGDFPKLCVTSYTLLANRSYTKSRMGSASSSPQATTQ